MTSVSVMTYVPIVEHSGASAATAANRYRWNVAGLGGVEVVVLAPAKDGKFEIEHVLLKGHCCLAARVA